MKKALLAVTLLLFWASSAVAQRDGVGSFAPFDAHDFDTVPLSTLAPTINLPLLPKSAGTLPGSLSFISPQSCYQVVISMTQTNTYCGSNGAQGKPLAQFYFVPQEMMGMTASATYSTVSPCFYTTVTALIGGDGLSSYHIPSTQVSTTCTPNSATVTTDDGTGLTATLTASSATTPPTVTPVTNSSGWTYTALSASSFKVADAFSNDETLNTSFTDTLGAATTITGSPITSLKYNDTTGTQQTISLVNGTSTTFQPLCAQGNAGTSVTPVTSISLPDGTSYGFTWDTNSTGIDGLIKTLTLRTGGTITFGYGGSSSVLVCANGLVLSTLKRTTSDGETDYSLSQNGTTLQTTTTVLDPGKNKSVYVLWGLAPGNTFTSTVDRYQNTGSVGTPAYTHISETAYCYNTHISDCSTYVPAYPITQLDTYQYTYNGATQVTMSHDVKQYDSTYGLLTSDAATDSINSQTITTTYVYGTYSSGSCSAITNTKIVDHPCTVTTKNGSTWLSESTYSYNSNGALTSSSACLSSTCTGSSALTTTYTPTTQGTYSAIQDPNGQTTNYTYGSCNSLMPTDVTTTVNSIAIDHKATWNCDAGVVTDTTDANSNEADYTYDSMNRLHTYHDYMGDTNTTTYDYGTPTLDHVKVTDNIGVVSYQYNDGLGRPLISQIYNGTNYDTVSHTYGWTDSGSHALTNFQTTTSGGSSSAACTAALDTACTNVTLTALTNPIAGPYKTTDANSGTGTYAINSKDWSFTAGPAPSGDGENTKVVQTEVDGFGRVSSTCALTSTGYDGRVACGQTMGNNGTLTSNTYSFPSAGVSEVDTTRGSQTHKTKTDALGRVTSVLLPETGSTARTFSYDSQSSMDACTASSRTSNGDLLRNNLPDGTNYECYIYDGLHRVTDVKNSVDSSVSPCKRYRYDATANGFQTKPTGYPSSGANIIGRLVEAETDDCTHTTALTDEWFAYDAMGRMTDMFGSTPNSGGYRHLTATYDADGNVLTLGGIPSTSTVTYTVDTEGRGKTAKIGTTTIVSAVTYDAGGAPTEIDIGAGTDKDTYSRDQLENMTQYQFFVGSANNKGVLTYNSIGSLASLAITDGLNSNNTETCNFGKSGTMGYDDVGRILDDDCGTVWAQTYSYDQYDNMKKSGSISYNPTYTASNNNDSLVTYDSNGNITKDSGSNTYTWNVYGQMASENSTNASYDAFGRMVAYSTNEYLYGPSGKVGVFQSGGPYVEHIPAPGGGFIAETGSGSFIYYHNDWVGSTRVASTVPTSGNGSLDWSRSFSPYGDPYNNGSIADIHFAGMDDDMFTGINYSTPNRARGFASSRWLSPDPAHSGWNAYAYVTDPNTQTDPSGLGDCDELGEAACVQEGGSKHTTIDCYSETGGCTSIADNPGGATQGTTDVPKKLDASTQAFLAGWTGGQGATIGKSQYLNSWGFLLGHGSAAQIVGKAAPWTGLGQGCDTCDLGFNMGGEVALSGGGGGKEIDTSFVHLLSPEDIPSTLARDAVTGYRDAPLNHLLRIPANARGQCNAECISLLTSRYGEAADAAGELKTHSFVVDDLTRNPFPELYNLKNGFRNHSILVTPNGIFIDFTAAQYGWEGAFPLIFRPKFTVGF